MNADEPLILAIDPGPCESGWVIYDHASRKVIESGVDENLAVLPMLDDLRCQLLAVEMMEARGMPLGRESLETVLWTGRFVERWRGGARLVYRREVKLHLCGSSRAKDGNVRQALIDRIGPPGVKRAPGPTYGVRSHAWAALGVALTAAETVPGGTT